ncbi:hypothetical protein CVT24_010693 [Panaeolus cyanescens]|uniref:HNH nuclease domain-containing protein n=1 Tax=Panaeolus cyanescens TaxID=181874 RepID=A0A409YM31_9AGAR|nr:hypothetical protein CVT24_010693 [Panaeolus cyanescens]
MSNLINLPTQNAIKRAENADPNHGRCLIENCSRVGAIVMTYMFNRDLAIGNSHLIDSLEWSWRMRRGTLNLDTRRNIFFCASMHALFRERKWCLIPREEDVFHFYDEERVFIRKRNRFVDSEGDIFTYTLLPLQDMEDLYITRQSGRDDDKTVSIHDFPFEDLPVIRSHLHPKFVILHLGATISRFCGDAWGGLLDRFPYLWNVHQLFLAWTGGIPLGAFNDPTYVFPRSTMNDPVNSAVTPPDLDDNGDRTPLHRNIPISEDERYRPASSATSSASSSPSSSSATSEEMEVDDEEATDEQPPQRASLVEPANSSVLCVRGSQTDDWIRPLTSLVLTRRRQGHEDLRPVRWTADRVAGWAKRCRSPTPPPSPTKAPLRRSTRIKKKPKEFLR